MTLALFLLGWFAISLLLGAAWAATASTRRRGMDTRYPLVIDHPARMTKQPAPAAMRPERVGGATMDTSDALAS